MKLIKITKSHKPTKKYDAHLSVDGRERIVSFGAQGYTDFTLSGDEAARHRYIARHKTTENWADPLTAGFWSRWYLWEKPDKTEAERNIRRRFNL